MKVGFVGLGKLGLPVAVAMAHRGVGVIGYDVSMQRMNKLPVREQEVGPDGTGNFNDWLASADRLTFGSLERVVNEADIIFVAVQTPHDERFEGTHPLRDEPVDFDYTWLKDAVQAVTTAHLKGGRWSSNTPLVVISTVLPGTMQREILPLLEGSSLKLVYNPFFIAMGTVMRDFLKPEFVLLGVEDEQAAQQVMDFYNAILPGSPTLMHRMSIPSAELTKVTYNTWISTKIALANATMEICHKIPGCNVDDVTEALQSATERLVSPAYMQGGMGDGGGCHPRDNIAMMWLGKQLKLSYNPSRGAMLGRQVQSQWLADLIIEEARGLPIVIAGVAFKPGTNITTGSAALLLKEQLSMRGISVSTVDKHVYPGSVWPPQKVHGPVCVVIGCRHPEFVGWEPDLPEGSVVIDPHRIVKRGGKTRVVHVGVGESRVIERHVIDGLQFVDGAA